MPHAVWYGTIVVMIIYKTKLTLLVEVTVWGGTCKPITHVYQCPSIYIVVYDF